MQSVVDSEIMVPKGSKLNDISGDSKTKPENENIDEVDIKSSFWSLLEPSKFLSEKPNPLSSLEDSKSFLENLFTSRELTLNEGWDFSEAVHGKVTAISIEEIFVDCIVDKENVIIQERIFPKILFGHLNYLDKGTLVIIKTQMKKGSFRLDIYPGDLIVKNEYFELNKELDSLKNKGLDNTLTEW